MLRSRRAATVLAAVATATSIAVSLAASVHAAAPTVELQPHQLTRGADIAVPHIEDGDFVDGPRRIELPGTVARVIGRSGESWLVGTNNVDRKRNRRVVRVEADGTVVDVLRNIDPSTVVLSADGSTLAWQRFTSGGRKVTTVVGSAADGTVLGSKGPGRFVSLLDVDAERVVLSGEGRTFEWTYGTGGTRTIVKRTGGMASLEHDLLMIYTKDPYFGGCSQLVELSRPRVKRFASCRERVAAISPDGTQMLTMPILTDGLGPGRLKLRTVRGSKLATYTTNWFSGWQWESPGVVLLDVNGRRKSATVRCTLGQCENATDPVKVTSP